MTATAKAVARMRSGSAPGFSRQRKTAGDRGEEHRDPGQLQRVQSHRGPAFVEPGAATAVETGVGHPAAAAVETEPTEEAAGTERDGDRERQGTRRSEPAQAAVSAGGRSCLHLLMSAPFTCAYRSMSDVEAPAGTALAQAGAGAGSEPD